MPGRSSARFASESKRLAFSRSPVEMSILEFDQEEDEIFLSYTWEHASGPPIVRTGEGPPHMQIIGERDGVTTHPFGLRLGTWLLLGEDRLQELESAERELEEALSRGAAENDLWVLRKTVEELRARATGGEYQLRAHDSFFRSRYPGLEIIAMQGCGDLTMNEWNVAYVNSRMAESPPALVHLSQEVLPNRTYSCLVKWKPRGMSKACLTIEELKFQPREIARQDNSMALVRHRDGWLARGDAIEFAVSNQQVIREGELVPVVSTCRRFGDIRHLLRLANVNPLESLYAGDPGRPRSYFNAPRDGDIWLGEEEILRDTSRNLLRAALSGPVVLGMPDGSSEDQLRGALRLAGYQESENSEDPLRPGQWRFAARSQTRSQLEIFHLRNRYAWTMIGLSRDNRRVFWFVSKGEAGRSGYSLEDAAQELRRVGAWNALLIDEGADAFQKLRAEDGSLRDLVPCQRRRLRATFIMAGSRSSHPLLEASGAGVGAES